MRGEPGFHFRKVTGCCVNGVWAKREDQRGSYDPLELMGSPGRGGRKEHAGWREARNE